MSRETTPKAVASAWSEPTRGLAGRLIVEFEDLKPGLRHAVYLELRNHSLDPIAVTNQPQIQADLSDASGGMVSTSGMWMSGPIPRPQWALIPREAYVGFRIDMQTVGLPTREYGMALLAIGDNTWELKAGQYVLEIALLFEGDKDGPQGQWVGTLELPPVQVVVTTQMLTNEGEPTATSE